MVTQHAASCQRFGFLQGCDSIGRSRAAAGSWRRPWATCERACPAHAACRAALRAEAAALESFIPVIVEGARSGMQQALAKQVRRLLGASWTAVLCRAARSPQQASQENMRCEC